MILDSRFSEKTAIANPLRGGLEKRLITIDSNLKNVDIDELIDFLVKKEKRMATEEMVSGIWEYLIDRYVERLSMNKGVDSAEIFEDVDGIFMEEGDFVYRFVEGGRSVRVDYKDSVHGSKLLTRIQRMINLRKGNKEHDIICDTCASRHFKTYKIKRRIEYAKKILSPKGDLSYMMWVPSNVLKSKDGKQKIIQFLQPYSSNLVGVFSVTSDEALALAREIGEQVIKSLDIMNKDPKHYNMEGDLKYFKDKKGAREILEQAHKAIDEIHDGLTELAIKNYDYVIGKRRDACAGSLRSLLKNRNTYSKDTKKAGRSLYHIIKSFPEEEQIRCLKMIFECMPKPNTSSIEALKFSLYGELVFPIKYLSKCGIYCHYWSKELPQNNIPFTPAEFENILSNFINSRLSHTGSTNLNEAVLKKLRLPGSYGTGKNR